MTFGIHKSTLASGPVTNKEKDYIAQHVKRLTPDEMAHHLKRNPATIRKIIIDLGYIPVTELTTKAFDEKHDIQETVHWKNIKEQFTKDEQEMFMKHWVHMHKQFGKDDVLYTEELQIIECIRIEILIHRLAVDQRKTRENIVSLEKQIKNTSDDDPTLSSLERQLQMAQMADQEMTKTHDNYLKNLYKLLEGLKGTREARIKMIESGKETLVGWFRTLTNDELLRNRMGVEMEKMRLAMEAEYDRLSDYHKFYDGIVDQPILNSETVYKVEDKNENQIINNQHDMEST